MLKKKNNKELKNHYLKSQILGNDNYVPLNSNTIVFGSSGTGKTRHYIKPNMLNMNGSYVVVDPLGELYQDLSAGLEKSGYKVKVLNLAEIGSSMKYNPFYYIREIEDISELSDAIISNINGLDKNDNQLIQAMYSLLNGIIGYMIETYPMEQRILKNMFTLLKKASLNDKSELDLLMDKWDEKTNGTSYSTQQYKAFKMVNSETAKNALVSISVLLSIFDIYELADLTDCDEMELDKVGEEKTAIFLIIPNVCKTSNFLVPVLCSQLLRVLYQMGNHRKNEENITAPELKVHTTFLFDESGNIGTIPNIDYYLNTCYKHNIGISCIFNSPSQLANHQGHKNIVNNITNYFNNVVHMGGTSEDIQLGDYIINKEDIFEMDNRKQIIYTKGDKPRIVDKFPLQYHPNYYLTSEADPSLRRTLNDMP